MIWLDCFLLHITHSRGWLDERGMNVIELKANCSGYGLAWLYQTQPATFNAIR